MSINNAEQIAQSAALAAWFGAGAAPALSLQWWR